LFFREIEALLRIKVFIPLLTFSLAAVAKILALVTQVSAACEENIELFQLRYQDLK
jgi:hypothetical protein